MMNRTLFYMNIILVNITLHNKTHFMSFNIYRMETQTLLIKEHWKRDHVVQNILLHNKIIFYGYFIALNYWNLNLWKVKNKSIYTEIITLLPFFIEMLQYDWLWSGHMIIKEMFHIPMKLKSELARASMTTSDVNNQWRSNFQQQII